MADAPIPDGGKFGNNQDHDDKHDEVVCLTENRTSELGNQSASSRSLRDPVHLAHFPGACGNPGPGGHGKKSNGCQQSAQALSKQPRAYAQNTEEHGGWSEQCEQLRRRGQYRQNTERPQPPSSRVVEPFEQGDRTKRHQQRAELIGSGVESLQNEKRAGSCQNGGDDAAPSPRNAQAKPASRHDGPEECEKRQCTHPCDAP